MIKRLMWRLRYTAYGQRKTHWGWLLWWQMSGSEIENHAEEGSPLGCVEYAVNESIWSARMESA